ncbi:hypothetical protein E1202_12095 [Saccharopolyspora karakumensis]|uniref:Ketohydroxyglutarate aldolase n=1 Tax=Saccharopolyspora karakumensis TaxID=2530386 RepID=A0A4R5BV73_9PSEU|nr:hypothetical protein [Saccharopolyspora karakumensis]TDD89230.1 hypothetical protein E1202_12095 [Saccharopolyspora karakumensis]
MTTGPERVVVTVRDDQLAEIDELAERLRLAGMRIDQVLGEIGVITGSLEADRLTSAQRLPGVDAIERETSFQVPPDEDVQ